MNGDTVSLRGLTIPIIQCFFKKTTGISPQEYREKRGAVKERGTR
jgi:hypothetical protein